MIARLIARWTFKRTLERNLRARRVLRPQRQAAARKAAETRRRIT